MSSQVPASSQAPTLQRPNDSYKRVAIIGYTVIFLAFGVVGGWAAITPISSSVAGPGVVAVDSNRKTIQHLEGGIVTKILVHEGDKVKAGQVLFELDQTVAHANYEISRNQLFTYLAQQARLESERDNRSAVVFPAEVVAAQSDPTVSRAMGDELRQFSERRATLAGQTDILNSRIEQSRVEIEGIDRQQAGLQEEVDLLNKELTSLQGLYDKGLVPQTRLLALQREKASLTGSIGRLIADRSKADKAIGETSLQIQQIKKQRYEDVSKELGEVSARIAEIRERYAVAQDTVKRVNVLATVSGKAQNLKIFTEGGVVRPGEPMVDIIPDKEELIVQAHFSPNDIENVHEGATVDVKFPSFHDRTLPAIMGTIKSVSSDRLVDEANRTTYYLALVTVTPDQLPPTVRGKLIAGLPAQVTVPTGQRTVLQYMTDPLMRSLQGALREK